MHRKTSLAARAGISPASDPDFLLPEEFEKRRWEGLVADAAGDRAAKQALLAHTVKAK